MLSNKNRQRLEFICGRISQSEEVQLADMIWAEKVSKSNHSANEMLRKARRKARAKDAPADSMDEFLGLMNLGDPDPTKHATGFTDADEIVDFFKQEKPDDWRQRD